MKLKDMTPAAQAALAQKRITGGFEGRALVKLLGELERWDNGAERRKKFGKWMLIGGTIASFFMIPVLFVTMEDEVARLISLPVFVFTVGTAILGYRLRASGQAIDLPNELRVSVRPLLKQLSQDLHPEGKIKVALNLAGIDESRCERPQTTLSGTLSSWVEDLGTIRMPLADGTEAVLRMENSYEKLFRKYRGRSGKQKSKTKWKKVVTVTAILIPPAPIAWESGRGAQMVDPEKEQLTFVEKNGVMTARLERSYKFKVKGDRPEDAAPATDILRMFIRLTAMRPQPAGGAR